MSLSEQEQRALREIEKSLIAEDPKFGASVASNSSFTGTGGTITLRGIALIVVGLVMLVGGIALAQTSFWFVLLSIAGFLVMFGSCVWMLRGPSSARSLKKDGKKSKSNSSSSGGSNGAASKLEENFRRRFEGN